MTEDGGDNDYSVYFKNEPSPYVWLSATKLKLEYVCVEIAGYPVSGQARFAFWVAGDGVRTLLYFTSGLAEVVANQQFTVLRVVGAQKFKIADGRIEYLMDEASPWKDLGPITKDGRRPGDTDFESMRCAHLKKGKDFTDKEAQDQVKKAVSNDFWSKGKSLSSGGW